LPSSPRNETVNIRENLGLHCLVWDNNEIPTGTAFLLVHGLASNARVWSGVASRLVELGHFVVAVDQRCHGRSAKPDSCFDVTCFAEDLELLIGTLDLNNVVVVGQSWGANVVVELAYRAPNSVRGIVAIDGGTIQLRRHYRDWDDCAAQLAPPELSGTMFSQFESAFRLAHPNWPEEGIIGTMENMELLHDGTFRPWLKRDHHMKILKGLWEHNPEPLFSQTEAPVLFLPAATPPGDQSGGWASDKHAEVKRAVALLRRARVSWFHDADHDLHAQYPLRVAQELHSEVTEGIFS